MSLRTIVLLFGTLIIIGCTVGTIERTNQEGLLNLTLDPYKSVVTPYKTSVELKNLTIQTPINNTVKTSNHIFDNNTATQQKSIKVDDQFPHNKKKYHWSHMPITYFIFNETTCRDREVFRLKNTLKEIMEKTENVVEFKSINKEPADITFHCVIDPQKPKHELALIFKEFDNETYIINNVSVFFTTKEEYNIFFGDVCFENNNMELHTILIGFGFNQSSVPNNILSSYIYDYQQGCDGKKFIDSEIIQDLKGTYRLGIKSS